MLWLMSGSDFQEHLSSSPSCIRPHSLQTGRGKWHLQLLIGNLQNVVCLTDNLLRCCSMGVVPVALLASNTTCGGSHVPKPFWTTLHICSPSNKISSLSISDVLKLRIPIFFKVQEYWWLLPGLVLSGWQTLFTKFLTKRDFQFYNSESWNIPIIVRE